ncbi:MAG: hypothetical protein K2Q22_17750, partial [Cytophagales bacterium]|nr:hypothetical protein [Cytophagales bacterium]
MKRSFRGLLVFLLALASITPSLAQDTISNNKKIPFSVGFYHHEGFFYKHRPSIYGLPDALAQGIEVNLRRITNGQKHWEQLYKYPQYGLTFIYMN